jgi:hypothetical protein
VTNVPGSVQGEVSFAFVQLVLSPGMQNAFRASLLKTGFTPYLI